MEKVRELISEMCEKTNISLRLVDFEKKEVFSNISVDERLIISNIMINNVNWELHLAQSNKAFLPFVKFTLSKLIKTENSIELLLEGKKNWSSFRQTSLCKAGKLILMECTDIDVVIEIVKDTYDKQNIYIEKVYNGILLVGDLEDEKEHGLSLRETILQSVGNRVYIAINCFDGTHNGFIDSYNDIKEIIEIGKALEITPEVYFAPEMNLEKAIYNLNDAYSKKLQEDYGNTFNKLSDELVQTLEEILNCNLSLSKAAKNLFIHRNTLMYRIEKLKKEIGLDIRIFKEATYLYILYINNKRRNR